MPRAKKAARVPNTGGDSTKANPPQSPNPTKLSKTERQCRNLANHIEKLKEETEQAENAMAERAHAMLEAEKELAERRIARTIKMQQQKQRTLEQKRKALEKRKAGEEAKRKDWISQLHDYASRERLEQPVFAEYFTNDVPPAYVVIVAVSSHPDANFMSSIHDTKQAARHGAAQVAIEWIQTNDKSRRTMFREQQTLAPALKADDES